MDKRTRDTHAQINGVEEELRVPFANGLLYPGDPSGPAKEVINCRCGLNVVVRMLPSGKKRDKIEPQRNGSMKLTKLIEQRNTGKGNPNAIFQFVRPLNVHQKKLLNQIPSFNSRTMFPKRGVNMKDLSALTAHISYKFAMFMKHNERLIIRGMFTWSALMRKQPVRWLPNGIVGAGIRFRV